ncbi:MAG: hypothetical protein LH606_01240 [Cytophagaceae bacterium]|nr:hypothetical protein [Cytophagaceae bacterium]
MDIYTVVRTLHSYLRWAVLILALIVIVRALIGYAQKKDFTAGDARNGLFFMISADTQLLLGLLLYFWLSPVGVKAFSTGQAMKVPELRYFAVEHIAVMLIAWVLIHVGYSRVKKLSSQVAKHKTALIFYGIALILILSRVPWTARPLLRN